MDRMFIGSRNCSWECRHSHVGQSFIHNLHTWVMFCMCFQISHRDRSCVCRSSHASSGFSKTNPGCSLASSNSGSFPRHSENSPLWGTSFPKHMLHCAKIPFVRLSMCAIGKWEKWRWMKIFWLFASSSYSELKFCFSVFHRPSMKISGPQMRKAWLAFFRKHRINVVMFISL